MKVERTNEIQVVNVRALLMPNGEVVFLGKTMGWYEQIEKYLSVYEKENEL